jgi:hypothetical protein
LIFSGRMCLASSNGIKLNVRLSPDIRIFNNWAWLNSSSLSV